MNTNLFTINDSHSISTYMDKICEFSDIKVAKWLTFEDIKLFMQFY